MFVSVALIPATCGPWYETSEHDANGPRFRSIKPTSCRWDRSAVDDVFGARDGRSARRGQECNQVCHLPRLGRSPKRNAAKTLHDNLLTAFVVSASLRGEPFREADGGFGLDPAGRDPHDADALGRHFLGEALAISGKRGFG